MKFLVVLALFVTIVYALPVDEIGQNQEIKEAPVALVDFKDERLNGEGFDVLRPKRQLGGE